VLCAALSLGSLIAAGTVVDLGVRSELRTSQLSEPVADGFSNNLTVGGMTPSIRYATQGRETFFDAAYAPNLSLIYPSQDVLVVLHRFNGQANWTPSPRFRLVTDVVGAVGDLDAGAAVRDLGNSRASALVGGGNLTQFPFADVAGGVDAGWRFDGRWTLNGGARLNITGSPSPGEEEQLILPPQARPEVYTGLTYLFSPTDSLGGVLQLRGVTIADERGNVGRGGGLVSVTPTLAYNRALGTGVVATTRMGWQWAVVDEGLKRNLLAHGLPVLDGRLQASVNLPGDSAIEGAAILGMGPFSDPLGGLLEHRVTTGVQGAWRVNRDLTLTTAMTAFGTLYAIGGNAELAQESNTAVGGSVGAAWNLTEWIAMNAEALGTSRVITDKFGRLTELRPELTVLVGLTGAFNAFHEGERPPGTDPRPGRAVGTRPVSLPGSSRAFTGRTSLSTARKERGASEGRQGALDPDDELDDDEVLDRRRRGVTVDERRLIRRKLEEERKALDKKEQAASEKARRLLEENGKRGKAGGSGVDGKGGKNGKNGKGPRAGKGKGDTSKGDAGKGDAGKGDAGKGDESTKRSAP
jgi:hypothetical protein